MEIPTQLFKAFDDTFDDWTVHFKVLFSGGIINFVFVDDVDPIDYCGFDLEPNESDFFDECGEPIGDVGDYEDEYEYWCNSMSEGWDSILGDLLSYIPDEIKMEIFLLGGSPYIYGFGVRIK